MEYSQDDYLMISGIQHFKFCRRQWALIHVEQQWAENEHTVIGELIHKKAHDPYLTEKRKDILVVRDLPVSSRSMGVSGECDIVVYDDKNEIGRLPLHNLETIVSFGYRGTSPALMGACVDRNISLCYLTPQGKFLARVSGKVKGNVVLRQQQFQSSNESIKCLEIAKNCILGKVYNSRWVLERAIRDHSMQIDVDKVKKASIKLKEFLEYIKNSQSVKQLRGYEGEAASIYFGVFDELILQQKKDFFFQGRNRHPPLDNVNAMLSFTYTLLTTQITSALEVVGLDPYVGYMHTERPGRASLSLDLIEELRAVMADRFVLSLINKKIVNGKNFTKKENGAVLMDTDIRKKLLSEWQNKKKEIITHPYLNEKVEWFHLYRQCCWQDI